jgi:hypothetical protein
MAKWNPAALSALANRDVENFLTAATPGGIELQEAAGQRDLCGTPDILPTNCPRQQLEKIGFVFGEPTDDIFTEVTFPKGWSKVATDHSMWSKLVDEKGRERGMIFYKAAFYDRSAHMHLTSRYQLKRDYLNAAGKQSYTDPTAATVDRVIDVSGGTLFIAEKVPQGQYDKEEASRKQCSDWLDANFPNWKDATAYWD